MKTTNLIIKIRQIGTNTEPYCITQSVIADNQQAHDVTHKYNEIAKAEKDDGTHYRCVPLTI